MNMREWLAQADKAERERVARAANTKVSYFGQIAGNHRLPSPVLARALHEATDGKLSMYELRPDIFGDLPKKATAA